ncbi:MULTISPECIES: IclR family transcriptional regulator [Methylotenera]|uniref:IclR family transcriptional regulator n=1 Tax=Methylotenera TaxID=359407 RepID=UPI000381732C|nr:MULTISPECIES: helix-turn-helix domain-containing protein [Methylotenera]
MNQSQPKSKSSEHKVGSLPRAAVILSSIARGSRKGSLLTELISRESLPRTTVVRTLDALMDLGWVVKDVRTHRFNLGLDLAALGSSAIARNPLERVAETELSLLAEKLNQVVYLTIRTGLDMVCIGKYESKSPIQIGRGDVGLRGPFGMTQSCMGMMARMPADEVYKIIEANLARYHRIEGFDETGFRQTIEDALNNGFGTYDNIVLDRTTSGIGVAIADSSGYPIASIGTTFLTGWLTEEQRQNCILEMKKSAEKIQALMFEF